MQENKKETKKITEDFDARIKKALEMISAQQEQYLDGLNTPVEFSEKFKGNMQLLLDQVSRNEKKREKERRRAMMKRYTKRIAVAVAAFIFAGGITIFSVDALRVRFLNLVVEIAESHSTFDFEGKELPGELYSDIQLNYIPDGFELAESEVRDATVYLKFKKEEQYFNVLRKEPHISINTDTQDAVIEKTTVNGYEAFYSSNSNINILVFHDNTYAYTINGNIEKDEIMKIAENIASAGYAD